MLRTLAVFLIIVPGFALALRSRFSALLLYLWLAFFRPQDWIWLDIDSLRLSLLALVLLVLPSFGTGVFPDLKHPLAKSQLLILISAIVAELTTPVPRDYWGWLQLVTTVTLTNLLLVRLADSAARLRTLVFVVIGAIGFHACIRGVSLILSPGYRAVEGVGGAMGDNNSFAVVAAMVAVLALSLARDFDSWWLRKACTASGVLCMAAVVATYSRGGFLAMAAGLVSYALIRRLNPGWLVGCALAGTLAFAVVPLPSAYTERLLTINSYEEDDSAMGRLHFWEVAVDMSRAHPLGVGVQNFNNVYNLFDFSDGRFGPNRSVHSSYFQMLTEGGWIGFATWLGMVLYTVMVGFKVRRRVRDWTDETGRFYGYLADGLVAAFISYLVGGAFTAVGWNDFVWCVVAIAAALDQISRQESLLRAQNRPATA